MKNFMIQLVGATVILAIALYLVGRINQKKFADIDGDLTAQYSSAMQWLVVISYGIISALPIIVASSLKEGNPFVDRIVFVIIHGFFLLSFLWMVNRRIVVGVNIIGVSNIFGAVRLVEREKLEGATLTRVDRFISATRFVVGDITISVDDHMQNCVAVVSQLANKSRVSAT